MKLNISKAYGAQTVFENLTFEIFDKEILCILGESGGGKTTLLNALAGLISYDGSIENPPQSVGYIFQEPRLLPNLTIEQNLAYAGGKSEDIQEILQKTELFPLRKKHPNELSGGEKQRVSIARAFLSDAPLLLLDEPFSSLDTALKLRLASVFAKMWEEKPKTTVFVTHDVEEALMLGHRVVVLKKGKIALDIRLPNEELPRQYGKDSVEKTQILSALLGEEISKIR